MRKERLETDIFLVTGEAYQANATVFVDCEDALLVDGLASREDAEGLRDFIERELGKKVRLILCTHYMSDHTAAFQLFPAAPVIAHKNYLHTFNSQRSLTADEKSWFRKPTVEISEDAVINWGRVKLDVFYNPGKTASSLNVDIAGADLLIVGDEIFGNTTFLSSVGTPETMRRALARLKSIDRSRVIPGHMGLFDRNIFGKAEFYLDALQAEVEKARQSSDGEKAILRIPVENCLPGGVVASDFEDEFHRLNLKIVVERNLFL